MYISKDVVYPFLEGFHLHKRVRIDWAHPAYARYVRKSRSGILVMPSRGYGRKDSPIHHVILAQRLKRLKIDHVNRLLLYALAYIIQDEYKIASHPQATADRHEFVREYEGELSFVQNKQLGGLRPYFSDQDYRRIHQEYLANPNETLYSLGHKYHMHPTVFGGAFRRLGLPRKPMHRVSPRSLEARKLELSREELEHIDHIYWGLGYSLEDVVKDFKTRGIPMGLVTLKRIMAENGIGIRTDRQKRIQSGRNRARNVQRRRREEAANSSRSINPA